MPRLDEDAAPRIPWTDRLGRQPRDLRISVTDRCNFRCSYCMPRDKVARGAFLQRSQITDFEEITRVASSLVQGGVQKIRITGGEPLLRRELPRLVEMLAKLDVELALTTNGVLLPEHAVDLKNAGLDRVTVSLDALDEELFQKACDAPAHTAKDVLAGIAAAEAAGFGSIKINCVVRRGINEGEIVPLVRHFAGSGHIVRFIEFMDVGTRNAWDMSQVVTKEEICALLSGVSELRPVERASAGDVAERYSFADGQGEVGVIASVSSPFCGDCCRLRLSADGKLYTCLFADSGHDVLGPLRAGASDEQLSERIASVWQARADRYSELRGAPSQPGDRVHLPMNRERVEMSYIGG